jgi:hypothetical protein
VGRVIAAQPPKKFKDLKELEGIFPHSQEPYSAEAECKVFYYFSARAVTPCPIPTLAENCFSAVRDSIIYIFVDTVQICIRHSAHMQFLV